MRRATKCRGAPQRASQRSSTSTTYFNSLREGRRRQRTHECTSRDEGTDRHRDVINATQRQLQAAVLCASLCPASTQYMCTLHPRQVSSTRVCRLTGRRRDADRPTKQHALLAPIHQRHQARRNRTCRSIWRILPWRAIGKLAAVRAGRADKESVKIMIQVNFSGFWDRV